MASEASTLSTAVRASNDLTARWCQATGSGDFVLSGAGLWPLLALLESAAAGTARTELAAVVGSPPETAQADALELVRIIETAQAASAALGLWLRPEYGIADARWASGLPKGLVGPIPSQRTLDEWAKSNTMGLIDRFPLSITDDDKLVLATALAVKTQWRHLFKPSPMTWTGQRIDGLSRVTATLDDVDILDGTTTVTRAIVTGVDDVDVHLLLGVPDSAAGDVMATGLAVLGGRVKVSPAADLAVGAVVNGLSMTTVADIRDTVELTLPPFSIRCKHDLCVPPERFGLTAVMDRSGGQLPALHPLLYVGRGAQDVLATFSHKGFEAAAVTAFAVAVAAIFRQPTSQARRLTVTFDRPFGFVAVHRPTGLALVAGWVAQPGTPAI